MELNEIIALRSAKLQQLKEKGVALYARPFAGSVVIGQAGRPKIEYIPMPEAIRDKYQYFTQADTAKLRAAGCSYRCRSLEAAVKDYVSYLKDHSYL